MEEFRGMDRPAIIKNLISKYDKPDALNEADTRHQIIDIIIHRIFHWPTTKTKCEKHNKEGYADYLLLDLNEKPILIIEAKKEGHYFYVPSEISAKKNHFVKIDILKTHKPTYEAIAQARSYALELGCNYASVFNGHQFIVFKAFTPGESWSEGQAFFMKNLSEIIDNLSIVDTVFEYQAIIKYSLDALFDPVSRNFRPSFNPNEHIHAYDDVVPPNALAQYLIPLAATFFDNISTQEQMSTVYVSDRLTDSYKKSLEGLIKDNLTPFFAKSGAITTNDDKKGGALGLKIAHSEKTPPVILLFGDTGAGKSTFLEKFFIFELPGNIRERCHVSVINLLQCADEKDSITKEIYEQLIYSLSSSEIPSSGIPHLRIIFEDELKIAKQEELFGIEYKSQEYVTAERELILKWKNDKPIFVKALARIWKKTGKRLIVIIDNTDQFEASNQTHCFTVGQNISKNLDCTTILALREERYFESNKRGILDAYQMTSFHLPSPDPKIVFIKRLTQVIEEIKANKWSPENGSSSWPKDNVVSFLELCLRAFRSETSPLTNLILNSSMGNIRQALKYFRNYISSGYCNVGEMISRKYWTIAEHQVLKAIMIPTRHFYLEKSSTIPNVFKINNGTRSSHFTTLRILKILSQSGDSFVSTSTLVEYFDSNFDHKSCCVSSIDKILKYNLAESDTRVNFYTSDQPLDLRLTSFGRFFLEYLYKRFTYIDLTSLDASVFDKSLSHDFSESASTEIKLGKRHEKIERMEKRIARIMRFVEYLEAEEKAETGRIDFVSEIKLSLNAEIPSLINSILTKNPGSSEYLRQLSENSIF